MSRSCSWRRVCPEPVKEGMRDALRSTMFILHQTGPTGFVLKREGCDKNFKVMLGDPHRCSCAAFKKDRDLCIHILWVLLKRFRIPTDHAIVYQLGLVEREIDEVLHGQLTKSASTESPVDLASSDAQSCQRRPITKDDVCPICQEELLDRPQKLTFCKYGCGKSVHLKCMKVWADHQRTQGETSITCPLCRENFGSFKDLCKELHSARMKAKSGRVPIHPTTSCHHCQLRPISGKCYKCSSCPGVFLCHSCFMANQHPQHEFEFRQHPSHNWRQANRPSLPYGLPSSLISDLYDRELTDNDYELLLELDRQPQLPSLVVGSSSAWNRAPHGSPHSMLPVEALDSDSVLVSRRRSCQMCSALFVRGDWVYKLPCKHKFHRDCVDQWLQEGETSCPIDGTLLRRRAQRVRKASLQSPRVSPEDKTTMLDFSISGRGLGQLHAKQPCSIKESAALIPSDTVLRAERSRAPPLDARQSDRHKPTPAADLSLLATSLLSSFHPSRSAPPPSPMIMTSSVRHSTSLQSPPRRKGSLPTLSAAAKSRSALQHGSLRNRLPQISQRLLTLPREQPSLVVSSMRFNSLPSIVTTSNSTIHKQ